MNKTTLEKNCKNCLYYFKRIAVAPDGFCDVGGCCINYNPDSPYPLNPPAMHDCLYWESKEKTDKNKLIP